MKDNKRSVRVILRKRNALKTRNINNRPIVYIFRSSKYIYGQCFDTVNRKVLCNSSSMRLEKGNRIETSFKVGKLLGDKLLELNIDPNYVIFDMRNYVYLGRVKSFIDGVRSASKADYKNHEDDDKNDKDKKIES